MIAPGKGFFQNVFQLLIWTTNAQPQMPIRNIQALLNTIFFTLFDCAK